MDERTAQEGNKCGHRTKECADCLKRWQACQGCQRKFARSEYALTVCPQCSAPRSTRYRYSKDEYDISQCPMCGNDRACDRNRMRGRSGCRSHGGPSKRGAESKRFKEGKYSKDAPVFLLQRFKQYFSDPEMMSLAREISWARSLTDASLAKLSRGESGELWKQAKLNFERLTRAIQSKNTGAIQSALTNLHLVLMRGLADEAAERNLRANLLLTAKLVRAEVRRERDLNMMISIAEFYVLMSQTMEVMMKYVPDKDAQAALAEEFKGIMVGNDQPTARPS